MADPLMATIDLQYRDPSSGFQPCKYKKISPIRKSYKLNNFDTKGKFFINTVSRILVAYLSVAYGRVPRKLLRKNAKQVKIEPFLYIRTYTTNRQWRITPSPLPLLFKVATAFCPLETTWNGSSTIWERKKLNLDGTLLWQKESPAYLKGVLRAFVLWL